MDDPPEEYDYVSPVNNSLECAICRQPFVSPSMAPACQHVFCLACISRALDSSLSCPIDRSPLRECDLVDAPRIVKQMVDELEVRCPNKDRGCKVTCERGLLEGHLREACEKGKGKGKAAAETTMTEECALCGDDVNTNATLTHAATCSASPTTCLHCTTTLPRASLPAHFLSCPSIPIPCPHAPHGCSARLPRSLMIEDHLEVSCAYEPIKDLLSRYDARLDDAAVENAGLKRSRQHATLLNETLRIADDVQAVRGVLHGVRMQMHFVLMELARVQGNGMGMSMGMVGSGGGQGSSDGGAESNSDDEAGGGGGRMRFFAGGMGGGQPGQQRPPMMGSMGSSAAFVPFPHGGGMKL
ncbi:hypothetical protein RQP46_001447 [Phenoliferia psychrophenolica]